MIRFLKRLGRDRRGVSAVEFALIAPAMIAFYFGLAEITQALLAERRTGHAASAIGDLVAQSSSVSNSELDEIFLIADMIMKPYSADTLKIRVSSLSKDSAGKLTVDWSKVDGMTELKTSDNPDIPASVLANGQSVILSEVSYAYDSPVDFFMPKAITFTRKFYLRPRKSDKVTKTG